jgi:hypothetical protein
MEPSAEIEAIVREKASKLETFAGDITGCRVVVERAAGHHRNGNPYEVRIDLTLPGEEIVVTGDPGERVDARDVRVVLRESFDSARRQLEDYVRRRRGE